jgi:hypothetical protein
MLRKPAAYPNLERCHFAGFPSFGITNLGVPIGRFASREIGCNVAQHIPTHIAFKAAAMLMGRTAGLRNHDGWSLDSGPSGNPWCAGIATLRPLLTTGKDRNGGPGVLSPPP